MARGLADGSIKRKFHIVEGLEQAPVALPMLFSGGNTGKLCVSSLLFSLSEPHNFYVVW
jgi:NADPH-dependent curcumin reductase CurA